MKKSQSMPSAAAAVVLGRAENIVRSVEELRRKIDEDARACGRNPKTVSHPAKQKSCPTTTANNTSSAEEDDRSSPPMASGLRIGTPTTSVLPVSTSITINQFPGY